MVDCLRHYSLTGVTVCSEMSKVEARKTSRCCNNIELASFREMTTTDCRTFLRLNQKMQEGGLFSMC